jgi:hypothetical protein
MIEEHERVVLTEDVDEYGLPASDVGTVLYIYEADTAYADEFLTLSG